MVTQVDPITLEVVRGFLVSTVLQMRATLIRTAYAPILYEARDFSCGLMTAGGELAAMSEDYSGHVFAMALGLDSARDKFRDEIHPGDVLATNDPYTGGTHLNDIAFYTPFFIDGEILMYIAVRAHHSDVGGATSGSFSGQDTEIYQEGMRIVPVKLVDKDRLNQALWDVLFANMRLSEERQGDALAMLDTARVAEAGISELCEKYGPDTIKKCLSSMLDGAEAKMRQRISELPNGDYYYEHYMDNGGLSPEPMPIKVKLTVHDDSMTFDFAGTAPQVVGPMNCGVPVTQGGVFVIVKSWLDPKSPVNGGTFRSVDFIIPEGSCLSAQLPAAVGGCWDVFRHLQSTIVGLFSQLMPDEPGGEAYVSAVHVYVGGYDQVRGRYYILYEYPSGGTPGSADTDGVTGAFGYDAGDIPSVYPAESAEQRQPLLMEGVSARADGESPGYRRSGFGVTRRVRILADTSQLNVMADRAIIPPWGASGASPGSVNSYTVIRDGQELQTSPIPGKVKSFPLKAGDIVQVRATSGGGVGDPLEREVERVLADVREMYVSPERAREAYGVVIEKGQADLAKTRELRQELRKRRQYVELASSANDEYDEIGCRIARLNGEDASRLGVEDGDLLEFVAKTGAPLRAWVRVNAGATSNGVPMGPIGMSIINQAAGDRVWVRRLDVDVPSM